MHDTSTPFVLREYPRYAACEGRAPRVILRSKTVELSMSGTLIDFSRCGAQLLLDQRPELANDLTISLETGDAGLDFTVPGQICWVRSCNDEKFLVGCAFEFELPHVIIPRLAEAGVIDRRVEPRDPISLPALIQRDSSIRIKAHLLDYSSGGFLMRTIDPLQSGERFRLELATSEGPVHAEAEARWYQESGDEFAVGCRFFEPAGAELIQRALGVQQVGGRQRASRKRLGRMLRWASFAVLLAGVWFGVREVLNG